MKKIQLIIAGALLLLSSCDDYLDVQPTGRTIPKTADEFSALLQSDLNDIDQGNSCYIFGNTSTIDYDMGCGDDFEICLSQLSGITSYLGTEVSSISNSNPYERMYMAIRDCNIVLDNLEENGTELSNNLRGTAYALRGACYYQLMRLYCDAPEKGNFDSQLGLSLVTKFDMEARPVRSSLQETIDLIDSDYDKALSYNVTDKLWLFTTDVVNALRARLYFWTKQWDKALPLAQQIVAKYPLASGDDYVKLMSSPSITDNNHLTMTYRVPDVAGRNELSYSKQNLLSTPVSRRFLDCFQNGEDSTDVRYSLFINKKRQAVKTLFFGMRTAEFKLMEAECYAHLGQDEQALASINDFRSHRISNYRPLTMSNLPAPNPREIIKVDADGKPLSRLMAVILNERRKELFLEQDRLFELKRNGAPSFWTASKGQKYVTEPYMYTFPIPEIDVRTTPGMRQNKGYTETIG